MGDMQVGLANGDDKVLLDKPVKSATSSNPSLQVSVSFGRFENDSLSWEKFSAFSSPNKYLEEVGKCATPGSVAQKKAYFEAHYKKIAERKAEIMEQEKQMERYPSFKSTNVTSQGNTDSDNGGISITAESVVNEGSNEQFTCEEDKHITDITAKVNEFNVLELHEESIIVKECQSSVDQVKEETEESVDSAELKELKEIAAMEEKPEVEVQPNVEEAKEVRDEVKEKISSNETPVKEIKKVKNHNLIKKKDGNVVMNRARTSPAPNQTKKPVTNKIAASKKTPPSREVNVMKPAKKPAVPVSKSPGFSTPRVYKKPASQITSLSTSLRKENVSALLRNKQTTPKSLHISLSLGPSASDPTALASTRKSLIMERMGDKDIVKRAFKSFQKSFDSKQQTPATDISPMTRPTKLSTAEKKSSIAHSSSSHGLKTSETTPKQKELSKLSAKPVEKTRLQKNTKAGLTDAKTRRDHLDPKAKSMQGPLPVRTAPKSSLGKVL